jgi:hypothetical protein
VAKPANSLNGAVRLGSRDWSLNADYADNQRIFWYHHACFTGTMVLRIFTRNTRDKPLLSTLTGSGFKVKSNHEQRRRLSGSGLGCHKAELNKNWENMRQGKAFSRMEPLE